MKKLTYLIASLITIFAVAQKVVKTIQPSAVTQSWSEQITQIKWDNINGANLPKMVETPVIRKTDNPYKLIADVTGAEELLLYSWGTADGTSLDHAAWGDPVLIDKAGNKTKITDLLMLYSKAGWGIVRVNTNFVDEPIAIKGKKYDNALICHSDGVMIFKLDKKYVRFESEVGIDDGSGGGSTIFRAYPISGISRIFALGNQYPDINNLFVNSFVPIQDWIFSFDLSAEESMIKNELDKLKLKGTYEATLKRAKAISDKKERLGVYISLWEKIVVTSKLQSQLESLNLNSVEIAYVDMSKMADFNSLKYNPMMSELRTLCQAGFDGIYKGDKQSERNLNRALELKRHILLGNPLLDADKLIVGRYKDDNARSSMAPMMGTEPNNWSNHTSGQISGFDGSIVELSNLRGDIKLRTIFKPIHGAPVADIKLHWNGDRILFSMPKPGDHHWEVYEIGVDGLNLKQVTKGSEEDLDYFDACYLPNGKLIVTSTIGGQGVPCVNGADLVGNLCLYDPRNHDMRRLTYDQDANWVPTVMHNGRVMYVRWEYTDLTHYFSRIVMHMNPDGTEQRSLYGSGSVFPTSIYDVLPLPDHATRFVGIISGHHGVQRSGRLVIFDPAKSRKEEKGMIQEIPFSKRPIVPVIKDEMVDGVWPQFLKPQPLNNDYFIVTGKLTPDGLWGIYLVDTYDNLTLISEFEGEGLIYGIPVRKTQAPPVIPEKVNLESKEATVFIQDIYEGEGLPGIKRGDVKELRVFAYEYAYLKSPSDHAAQGIQSGWDLKRLLGTVPVEADGSVIFKIPANTPISLQPLGADGGAVQWMRSWLTAQPGETVSCVGCHEDQNQIPMPKRVIASTKQPTEIKKPEGGVRSFTFDLEIQPILDRNCTACHNGLKGKLNYTGGRKDGKGYSMSYLDLHPYVHRQGPEAGMKVLYPYEYHHSNSQLVRMLKVGHYGVKLTDKEWRTLFNWIDFNAPDKGVFETHEWHGGDQYSRRIALNKKYANGVSVDWRKELSDYSSYLKNQPTPDPIKPIFNPVAYKEVKSKHFPFDPARSLTAERKEVEVAPGLKLTFVRIPAGEFIMGKNVQNSDFAPAHKVKVKNAFWMSENEISNELMTVLVPTHDSRYVDQQWKDHVTEGYEAFLPHQSASRVSYREAEEFCQKLAKRSGLNVMIPTEVQWEWACRAGTDSDFWYGGLNDNFGDKENLADSQTLNLAVHGVDPKPMKATDSWYPYYTWLPKEAGVDDGQVIVSQSGLYKSNPFGLHDMHGNVAEWTRSDYFPYPYNEKLQGTGDRKVVRGGSWKDHPKYSTSAYRKAFRPEQKPFNVGFRVIIEE